MESVLWKPSLPETKSTFCVCVQDSEQLCLLSTKQKKKTQKNKKEQHIFIYNQHLTNVQAFQIVHKKSNIDKTK